MLFAADDALNAGDDFRDSEQTDQSGDELEAIQQAVCWCDEAGMPLVGSRPTVQSSIPKKALMRPLPQTCRKLRR